MADLKRTVEIIFEGTDKTGDAMKGISASLERFNTEVGSVVDPLAGIGTAVLGIDAALLALAAGGLAIATKASGDFSGTFAEITTLFSATGPEIAKFREDVLAYAAGSTASIEQINQALYNAISAGTKYSDSLALLKQAEMISIAGKTDLNSATLLLTGTMNAYGAGVDEAGRYSDAFFTIVKDGVTTIPALAANMADVTAIAAAAGIPIETLGAAIAALTNAGLQTPQAMTALKSAIIAISAPTEETKKAAAALGVEIGSAAVKSKGFEVVLRELYLAADGNAEVLRKIIPNVESIAAVMVLGGDKAGKFALALQDMAAKAGATAAAYQKMADNMALITQQMVNNIQLLLISVGDKLTEGYAGISLGISGIFAGLVAQVQAGTFDPIIKTIQELAARMAAELEKLAGNLPAALKDIDFSDLITALKNMGIAASTAFSAMFGGVDLTTTEGLRIAIQKIISAFEAFTNVSAGVIRGVTPLISSIEWLVDTFAGLDSSTQESLGQLLGWAMGISAALVPLGGLALAIAAAGATFNVFAATGLAVTTGLSAILAGVTPLVGAIGGLAALFTAAAAAGGFLGLKLQEQSTTYNSLINSVTDYAAKFLNLLDFEAEANKLRTAGTNLTKEQIEAFRQRNAELAKTPAEVTTTLTVAVDKPALEKSKTELLSYFVDGEQRWMTVPIKPEIDQAAAEKAKKALSDELLLKRYQIEVEADTDKFKAQAGIIEKAMQFKASVDIAQIQASAKVIEALAGNISKVFETSSSVISTTLGLLTDQSAGSSKYLKLLSIIDTEIGLKQEALALQKKLTESQVAYMDAKTRSINRGDAQIRINADGMEPEIEAFMWRILGKIQLRAAAEQAEFLLGITA